ncbi:MAG: type II toxin-antitoxin system RelE family toxin [Anaerolineae bacterium]
MTKWRLEWSEEGLGDLDRLDQQLARQVGRSLERLAETGHGDLIRLRQSEQGWRLRVRDWRVILDLDQASGTIRVIRMRHRSSAYKWR